jgi:hypothetical protein
VKFNHQLRLYERTAGYIVHRGESTVEYSANGLRKHSLL